MFLVIGEAGLVSLIGSQVECNDEGFMPHTRVFSSPGGQK